MTDQKSKLMSMIATAVTNLHQVEQIIPAVEELGRRHVEYGVTADHYKPVGEALIYTLEKVLGDDFTPDVEEAWITTYTTLESVMTKAASEVKPEKKGFFSRMFGR